MFDTGVTIGDQLLQEVLGKRSETQMKSIVATIQQEQNRIIRNERARLLLVQGAAGSGKTSAALQRAAYLLYRYRETLRAEQIVLFSPNSMFNTRIKELQESGHRTIAVICKTLEENRAALHVLQGAASLRLIGKETASFVAGTVVIPVHLAKGIEFAAVMIYNVSRAQYGLESERKLLYTACTRAMHELHLYSQGVPTPFIRNSMKGILKKKSNKANQKRIIVVKWKTFCLLR